MKKHLTLLFVFVCVCLFAQEEKITFRFDADTIKTIVIKVPGMKASEIYDRTVGWSKSFYVKNYDLILSRDSINYTLSYSDTFYMPFDTDLKAGLYKEHNHAYYKLSIECYDNRYLVCFEHIKFVDNFLEDTYFKLTDFFWDPRRYKEKLEGYEANISLVINSINTYIKTQEFVQPRKW
ncbi:DUF4468 domain-containing protein [Flavobacterium alkalisoli]|uniref:DUF4468 domain-containing protein n=1 Tax=Flavobacterium alkalisoli TaxID=2602769 RepID=A0A5B9FVA2_9FLAO|nr:DUF4468 domain-containing protein [Flavobacterium alkalisoli]QEE50111.1 DUF4468 domain-containing protein [Flavobacterium alkalisoli]